MDSQPNKRRSIFGLATNLFRGSSAPADDSDSKIESPQHNGINKAQSVPRIDFNSATHESPAKRASDAQLASRKLIGRPQGPSSKLAQSFTSTDFTELSSAPQKKITFHAASVTGATRRMPGDNPYKSPSSTASKGPIVNGNGAKAASFSGTGTSTAPSNIFRSGTPSLYQRPSGTNFAPRIVPGGLKSSLPQTTPGRTSRHSTAELLGAVPVNTELFKMRIPEPPHHLTGEVLAKEVPDDPHRAGSIYADEFLAHYCPPDLDEQQKKQFFCILDLRRLKYAADEIFTKKDWKINILNFAKEYEKSRSLIMLRYGLYEFKTVRASEEVKKEWRQKHGIAESEEEASASSNLKTPAGSKRKAEEELSPIDGALKASTTAGNKRPRASEPASPSPIKQKPKRKASTVGSPDEVQPAKLQKASGTPTKASSATKSFFESIVNNTPTATVKKAATGAAKAATTKPALKSVFETAPKPASSGNIFSHLSDSKSSNDDDDADSDAETASNVGDDEDEPEAQRGGSASTGVATPQFGLASQAAMNGGSSASSDAGGSFQGRSIFDRITRGPDGQPIRKPVSQDGKSDLFSATLKEDRPLSTIQEQASSPAPVNNTWNTQTPIKFSSGPSNPFGAATSKPAAPSNLFGAPAAKEADEPALSKEATQDSEPKSLFGAPSKKADEPISEAPKAPAASPFSFGGKTVESSASTPSLFGTSAPSAPAPAATSSLFGSGASTPLFGQAKDKQESKETTPAPSLFGAKPAESSTIEASKPLVFQSNTLFGSAPVASEPSKTQPANLFSKPTTAETQATQAPASLLFGASASKPATPSLFGSAPASTADEPVAKKFAFGSTETKPAASTFSFGSTAPAPDAAKEATTNGVTPVTETKSIFGGITTPAPATEVKSLFGGTGSAAPATQTTSLFGNTSAPATETKSVFGNATTPAPETKSLFGNTSTTAPAETKILFGNATTSSAPSDSKPLFGASTSQPEASKPLFGIPSSQPEASKSLFGAPSSQPESSKPASLFGNNNLAPAPVSASSSFTFGSTAAPATTEAAPVATSSFTFGSASPAHTPQPGGSFSFGVTPASQPSQPEQNGNLFGANTSFTFSAAGNDANAIKNPFATGAAATPTSSSFAFGQTGGTSAPFVFGQNSQNTPSITFGGSQDSTQQNGSSNMFAFGGQQPSGGGSMFNLAPPVGGTSTGTDSPKTFGGASSLATTPGVGTPEPVAAESKDAQGTHADGDEAPQEQISLVEGGPGEEDESVVYEVRAKAYKLVAPDNDDDEGSKEKKKPSVWKTQGVGPLRLLKHKDTGAVRMLMRVEPRGNIALNKTILPNFTYKPDSAAPKNIKITTATDDGKGLETWMLTTKTTQALADALEEHKKANEKKD
ncbi:hypothetical protein QBC32DRAFT_222470 [Pseudoneurospora amorphoporcata]|uniref:RanBD1 domain-containing protein n=1 Tax=Pseudoneurospora amorphoporcata TaxID=241081 RepID=A0AAN6NQA1_9PEZI|nr:hypothetical protein QBC32DRAFT_222470 [Pseudoneurospora amorphoporcata]